jgi:PAS domain S-box-containing protein
LTDPSSDPVLGRGFLAGAGETGALISSMDWSRSPIGPIETWPQSLKTSLGIMLHSPVPMAMLWGPDGVMLYNDAYSVIAGKRHPQLLGSRVREGWPEVVEFNDHVMRVVFEGRTLAYREQELTLHRHGEPETVWMNLDYSPVIDESGRPGGVLAIVVETTERVLAERRQAAQHERLVAMCEQAPGFIAMLEGPEHRFALANAAYRRLIGREDVIGKTVREALPEVEEQGFVAMLDRVYASAEPHIGRAVPIHLARRAGRPAELRRVDFIYQPVTEAGAVTGIFVEGFDVTEAQEETVERARAEEALRASRRELELLADALPVLVSYMDADVRYQFVNKIYEAWFPWRREDIQGKSVREVVGEAAYAAVAHHIEAALAGKRVSFEQFMPYKAGRHRHVRVEYVPRTGADGSAEGIYALVQDITEEKRVEAELRRLNETLERRVAEALAERKLFADIVESTDLFVQVVDPNYRWLAVNRSSAEEFAQIFGVRRPEAGDDMLELLAAFPEHQAAVRAIWSRALGGEDFLEVAAFGDPMRKRRTYEMRFRALRDEAGAIVGAYQIVQDVTERLAEQDRLKAAETALMQAQKMEAIGQLTGGIAHDFNNVLGAVVAGFDLIRRRAHDPEQVRNLAEQGRAAAERGSRLSGQLLAFARTQRMEVKPVAVLPLVEAMAEMLVRTLGPMVRLTLRLDPASAQVLCDPVQLEMSILNLAINARDAMPDGGEVIITARPLSVRGDTELPAGDYVELAVTDTGTGMTPEVASRALDPFFTTKGVGKGTGLGLSQVYGSVRQAGGTIRIESRPGEGTTIRILLPRTDAPAAGAQAPAQPEAEIGGAAATVLLIDDDDDLRLMLSASLRDLGYRVLEAEDGPSGLALLREHEPDIMLVDFAMPGMNGAEVAAAARERWPDLPIVFASGYADTAAIEQAVGKEAAQLRKPFRIDDLQALLTEALANSKFGRQH